MVRNSADHGIERPDEREKAGKPRLGKIILKAYHESGQVNIDILDDGAGINPDRMKELAVSKGILTADAAARLSDREAVALIFAPGFSTADQVSDVSGRGVGMDVVKTNIEQLGGVVDIESTPGERTRISLKLPLTLAIISSLIVTSGSRRFAAPQVNIEELVRVRSHEVSTRIEEVQGKPILRLREKLLPLVRITDVLGLPSEFVNEHGVVETDRRRRFIPIQLQAGPLDEAESNAGAAWQAELRAEEAARDDPLLIDVNERRRRSRNALHILVLKVGVHRYGLVVDKLHDSEEIVVKALSAYLKECKCYAGSTIMGDGKVAMILDAKGIADTAQLRFADTELEKSELAEMQARKSMAESQSILIFHNETSERFAINLALVARVERVRAADIERVGSKEYLKTNDTSLRIVRLHNFLPVATPDHDPEEFFVIVPKLVRHPVGIVAHKVEDVIWTHAEIDRMNITGTGILGSTILDGQLIIYLNMYSLFAAAEPELYEGDSSLEILQGLRVLLVEDTPFFMTLERDYLESFNCIVDTAENGLQAWEKLTKGAYDLLVTDIEMPAMDGLELTQRVRNSDKLRGLPVIALTALISESARERGMQAGVDAYETKLDKQRLGETLVRVMEQRSMDAVA